MGRSGTLDRAREGAEKLLFLQMCYLTAEELGLKPAMRLMEGCG